MSQHLLHRLVSLNHRQVGRRLLLAELLTEPVALRWHRERQLRARRERARAAREKAAAETDRPG